MAPGQFVERGNDMLIFLKVLVLLSLLMLVVGLIKPKWVLFWMRNPDRLLVSIIALLLFMASWTGIASLTLTPKAKDATESTRDRNELDLGERR
jgi:hypothetical protein